MTRTGNVFFGLLGTALAIVACLIYFTSISAVFAKHLLLVLVCYGVYRSGSSNESFELFTHDYLNWFFIFWVWLLFSSLISGFIFSGTYVELIRSHSWTGLLWILESLRVWGILILLVYLLGEQTTAINFSRVGVLFLVCVYGVGLLFGYGVYFIEQFWQSGHEFEIFTEQTNTVKYLNLHIPIVLAISFQIRNNRILWQLLLGFLSCAGIVAVYLTQSRAGIASLFVSLGILIGVYLWYDAKWTEALAVLFVCVVLVGAFYAVIPNESHLSVWTEFTGTVSEIMSGDLVRQQMIWPDAMRLISRSPIIGHAAGTYLGKVRDLSTARSYGNLRAHPHSMYLQVLYQGGIIGFILFLVFSIRTIATVVTRIRKQPETNLLYAGFLASFTTNVFVHGLVEPFNLGLLALMFCWLVWIDDYTNTNSSTKPSDSSV